jgi:hypothetical protein
MTADLFFIGSLACAAMSIACVCLWLIEEVWS